MQRIRENQLVSSTWTPSFYGYDGHGNVRFLTSTTGALGNTYQFDAFGMPVASAGTTANTYLYSGERFDQNIGLYHLRARYYNQATGRFETMDPELGNIFNPGTLHKYAYAEANPVNYVDPNGTDPLDEEGTIDSSFYRFITRFKKWADPAARARICYTAALLQGLDPDATWAAYASCILKNSAPFN